MQSLEKFIEVYRDKIKVSASNQKADGQFTDPIKDLCSSLLLRSINFYKGKNLLRLELQYDKQSRLNSTDINEIHKLQEILKSYLDAFFPCKFVIELPKSSVSSNDEYLNRVHSYYRNKVQNTVRDSAENAERSGISQNSEEYNGSYGENANGSFEGKSGRRRSSSYKREKLDKNSFWGKVNSKKEPSLISEVGADSGTVQLVGTACNIEISPLKDREKIRINFDLRSEEGAVSCILFAKADEGERIEKRLGSKVPVLVQAEVSFDDRFTHDLQAKVSGFTDSGSDCLPKRKDLSEFKRIELHAHTKLSAKDSICSPSSLIKTAASFSHPAVAITDHGVVQAFPEAYAEAEKIRKSGKDIKLIYGMEGYLIDDGPCVVFAPGNIPKKSSAFVALDLETTGLDQSVDKIIEIGAIKFELSDEGKIKELAEFSCLVDPETTLPEKITKITGISPMDLLGCKTSKDLLPELHEFISDLPVVAHNGLFDLGFLRSEAFRAGGNSGIKLKFNPVLIDTLELSRVFLPGLNSYRLGAVLSEIGHKAERSHRAVDDARSAAVIFSYIFNKIGKPYLNLINEMAGGKNIDELLEKKPKSFHFCALVRNRIGLYNLYRLVSDSHINFFKKRPLIPKSELKYFRTGLLIGSACEAGELFRGVKEAYLSSGKDIKTTDQKLNERQMREMFRFYDYVEIMPLSNNNFLLTKKDTGIVREEDIKDLNRLLLSGAHKAGKPAVATGDVHVLNKSDSIYRAMMLSNMGYDDAEEGPSLYFRNTEEMLAEYSYFPDSTAKQLVIDNPSKISELIEDKIPPFPDGSFPPEIPDAAEKVKKLSYGRAITLYGRNGKLPHEIEERLKRELDSIISNGFAVMYYIAHLAVKKSNDDGYIVGSRGSVGSSLVANLCGISEVNPLLPHYRCPECHYTEFDSSGNYGSGFDLPEKFCPECGTRLLSDGQNIPFETFLGFTGEKQPDIDLNFSGEYQSSAHKFIREVFGYDFTFKAGTVGTYAEKNAEGLVRSYLEQHERTVPEAEIRRLAEAFIGVKRTTGQHPGGMVVIPSDRDIYEFTPIQYPANDTRSEFRTTHFDFNAMHDTIFKFDILGHDDPTVLHLLSEFTGIDIKDVPFTDPELMKIFTSKDILKLKHPEEHRSSALGLPEMGTIMAGNMIDKTKPSHFYDLVQLMGLSHGTDVWKGNAESLIDSGICTLNDVIGCRDSIMTTLIHKGLPHKTAFDIMEKVRKGKGLSPEHEAAMMEHNVEDWYIESCKKIKYMFPKAHAAAYAISSLRIAWFKVYRPAAFYAAYFTVRADVFDSSLMCLSYENVSVNRREYSKRMKAPNATDKDTASFYILELVEEMMNRGISFAPISLDKSDSGTFLPLSDTEILPPFDAIPGISRAMGEQIIAARKEGGSFHTKEDLRLRSGLGQKAILNLEAAHVLDGMPENNEISLFELM